MNGTPSSTVAPVTVVPGAATAAAASTMRSVIDTVVLGLITSNRMLSTRSRRTG
jgi:hypothetical protein